MIMVHFSHSKTRFNLWISGICLLALHACKTPVIEPETTFPPGTGTAIIYPLKTTSFPGFSGEFQMEKLSDGSASGKLILKGFNPANRYFGKISRTEASSAAVSDFVDLHELDAGGISVAHLKRDYSNKSLQYDSLRNLEGVVRVLEFNPEGGSSREVLRGDFGSSLILDEVKNFQISDASQSGINGTITFKKRINGNLLFTGNLNGLSGTNQLELSFFRGSPDGTNYRVRKLGQISSVNASDFNINFPENLPGLSAFDTLNGFIAFEELGQSPDSTDFKALTLFGGNVATGNRIEYPLYSANDSSVLAMVEFAEFGQSGSPVRMKFTAIPGQNLSSLFLSLHRGLWLDQADKILSIRIPSSGKFEKSNIPDGSGNLLTFNNISAWNAHFRLAEDSLGSNLSGIADIGANEVMRSDSLVSYLSEFNPSFNYGGSITFKKRLNGNVLACFRLSSTQSGLENNLIIRTGPKPAALFDTTNRVCRVAVFNGINPGFYKGFSKPVKPDGQPFTWPELQQAKNENNYLEYSFSDSGDFQVISRGDL
jgi:hypothetical protein